MMCQLNWVNTLRLQWNYQLFADIIVFILTWIKRFWLSDQLHWCIFLEISFTVNQYWLRYGTKPLPWPMMTQVLWSHMVTQGLDELRNRFAINLSMSVLLIFTSFMATAMFIITAWPSHVAENNVVYGDLFSFSLIFSAPWCDKMW